MEEMLRVQAPVKSISTIFITFTVVVRMGETKGCHSGTVFLVLLGKHCMLTFISDDREGIPP